MGIRNPRDFWAGAIYLALAIVVIWIGRNYQQGTSARMGPGYFPYALGMILGAFGLVSIGRSFIRPGEPIEAIAWRPLATVPGKANALATPMAPVTAWEAWQRRGVK